MMVHDAFHAHIFPGSVEFPTVRRGIEYVGRLADKRERDIFRGWRAIQRLQQMARSASTILPHCVQAFSPKSWNYTYPAPIRVDGERRYLSYCIYGARDVDRVEFLKTLNRLKQQDYYWGWTVILLIRQDVNEAWVKQFVDVGFPLEVYLVNVQGDCSVWARDPMLWRASFPIAIPHVDRFVSRDCDSESWPREWHAVQEWLLSGLNFHFMRDHMVGHDNAVMGGMWGAVGGSADLIQAVKNSPNFRGDDQVFYASVFQENVALQLGHDSHYCVKYKALPFPDPMWIHFVGQTPTYRFDPAKDAPECISMLYDQFLV